LTVELDLEALIRSARIRLPSSHRALLEQIGVQDAVVYDWPAGAQALYETVRETPPRAEDLSDAVAVWLQALRVVAYNGALLSHALGDPELSESMRQMTIDNVAWHEYGHALSVTRASAEDKRDGPRLVELLPPGLRRAVDYPGGYRPRQVFDEVVANVYALMISRLVHHDDYVVPDFLHVDLYDAFRAVVPWPPDHR
jgi:hypothetical protein